MLHGGGFPPYSDRKKFNLIQNNHSDVTTYKYRIQVNAFVYS